MSNFIRNLVKEQQSRLEDIDTCKMHLDMINGMLTSLTDVSGLDSLISHIISIMKDTICSDQVAMYWFIEKSMYYRDVLCEAKSVHNCDDRFVNDVIATHKAQRIPASDNVNSHMPHNVADKESWYFPLIARGCLIGIVVVSEMSKDDDIIWHEIQPFFTYAALMLDNEISNYRQLAEAHRRLQESEECLQTLFDESPFGVVLVDPATMGIIKFNRSARLALGYDADEFATLQVRDFEAIDDDNIIRARTERLLEHGSANFETVHRTKHGELRNVMVHLKIISISGKPTVQAIFRDITERKLARQMLELYQHALDNAHDLVLLIDSSGTLCFVNVSACENLGYSRDELQSMGVYDIDINFPRSAWETHWHELAIQRVYSIETEYRTKSGSLIPVEVSLRHFFYDKAEYHLAVARNLSERKQQAGEKLEMERRLLHSQKLESLGVLAGGIAHDFNNLLAAIMGNLDLSLLNLPDDSPSCKNIRNAFTACQRAADLTRQMLDYSGKGAFENRCFDLGELVLVNAELLRTSIPRSIDITTDSVSGVACMNGDPSQVQQVVMNLITNGAESIVNGCGNIIISTGSDEFDATVLAKSALEEKADPGRYCWLEVVDNGSGMDEETRNRIFEPFFTTKFTGRGLGMSAVLGIVRSHKGAIIIESAPGAGSRFKILFPASTVSEAPPETFDATMISGTSDMLVLVVDDEEAVRTVCSEMLQVLGYSVITADNGLEAVQEYEKNPEINFVILDLTMPVMDGERCLRELKKINPDIKVIIASGFSEYEVSQRFIHYTQIGFIQKPYRLTEIYEATKRISVR